MNECSGGSLHLFPVHFKFTFKVAYHKENAFKTFKTLRLIFLPPSHTEGKCCLLFPW